jgi:glutamate dehydrogenase
MKKISQIINEVSKIANNKSIKGDFNKDSFINFLNKFYLQNQGDDFLSYSSEKLYNLCLESFKFFQEINLKNPSINIYNFDQNSSPLTIIDIVNIDMPFLVDSVVAHLQKNGLKVLNIIHPIYFTKRKGNKLQEILDVTIDKPNDKAKNEEYFTESVIQIHIENIESIAEIEILKNNIFKILNTVHLVVNDWKPMITALDKAKKQIVNLQNKLNNKKPALTSKNLRLINYQEIQDFIQWLNEGNFIFLGLKEFDIKKTKNSEYSLSSSNNSYGVFNSQYEEFRPLVVNSSAFEIDDSVNNPYVIEILKSRYRSQVHMIANAERIRIQKFNDNGEVIGEFRFIGFFTSKAYNQAPNNIPLVRNKIVKVIKDSKFLAGSHNYKELVSVLESYPKDELFQISEADLLRIATGIVNICGRSQIRFFARHDKFNRFVSCLIFTPRDSSNSELRYKIKNYLADIYQGEFADSSVHITESNLVRFHVIIRTNNGLVKNDEFIVAQTIEKMTRQWNDELREEINNSFKDDNKSQIIKKYCNAFSVVYSNKFSTEDAVNDIIKIECAIKQNKVIFNLYQSQNNKYSELKIYSPHQELTLSDLMPILESFNFRIIKEATYFINPISEKSKDNDKKTIYLHYFQIELNNHDNKLTNAIKNNFEEIIELIWNGDIMIGSLNRLVIAAEFNWQQIFLLRAYNKYIHQTGSRYSQQYIAAVLVENLEITKLLIDLFENKFSPSIKVNNSQRISQIQIITDKIHQKLNEVKDANQDLAIKKFLSIINATTRTNLYQQINNQPKKYLSFKFDCSKIPDLPLPVPFAEIFVYSSNMEGVHLRGGKVARGGLRWSDRHEDFRTEILGLMKAQMTKNAVIVPVGSKGGFVVKKSTNNLTREQILKDGIDAYKTFLSGLLDLTDNVINNKIAHPDNLIIYDQIDPYLVVAADKGTATFSDIANSVSAEYNFWLGDAFASGGSAGYDHKKMGITAKGAWVSVRRHFRELGFDTQNQDFTAVGIGDLSGDVFGNGMLLSPHIKLLAAFNHLHIFLDPNPDSKKSFIERERIFNLPRSTWLDYDKKIISKGGGIFERSAKTIKISPEIQKALDINKEELSPNDLIKAILSSPVDLLWNGGIGTYFKSQDENNIDVGDRNNDPLRINGNELRCKVVGEGGNLGFTQKARIEFALKGGKINTDAMDNSAGVDCSDHEVNIKIALIQALKSKKINLSQRNKILEEMTEEVANLVLKDNHLQTQAVSIAHSQSPDYMNEYAQFIQNLEKSGLLNRSIEFLPTKKEIDRRIAENQTMTRPELCVMLAYAKMEIYNNLLQGHLVDDNYFEQELFEYFPKIMQKKLADEISNHQLRREIIATQITNFIVNRIGITFTSQIAHNRAFNINQVVCAIIICCEAFQLKEYWQEVESLDFKVDSQLQLSIFNAPSKLLERSVIWLLNNHHCKNIKDDIVKFKNIVEQFSKIAINTISQNIKDNIDKIIIDLTAKNIKKELATKIAMMNILSAAFEIAKIDEKSQFDMKIISKIYFITGDYFSLKFLRGKINNINASNNWHKLSCKILLEDLYDYQVKIAKKIATSIEKSSIDTQSLQKEEQINKLIANWLENRLSEFDRFNNFVNEIKLNQNPDSAVFIVAMNYLKALI